MRTQEEIQDRIENNNDMRMLKVPCFNILEVATRFDSRILQSFIKKTATHEPLFEC